jgi:hypothetical protein
MRQQILPHGGSSRVRILVTTAPESRSWGADSHSTLSDRAENSPVCNWINWQEPLRSVRPV